MHYAGISTYQFIPYYASAIHRHTHTCILKPFEPIHFFKYILQVINQKLGPVMSDGDIFSLVSNAQEFDQIKVR